MGVYDPVPNLDTPKNEGVLMPKRIAPLTDTKIRTTKPAKKPQKFFDGGGLFLLVTRYVLDMESLLAR